MGKMRLPLKKSAIYDQSLGDIKVVHVWNLTWKSGAKKIDTFYESQVENESLKAFWLGYS